MFTLGDAAYLWWLNSQLVLVSLVVYVVGKWLANKLGWPRGFTALSPGSQYYVVANVWKACVLCWITCQPEWWGGAWNILSTHIGSHTCALADAKAADAMDAARKYVVIYVACDISQFALVPMRMDTIVHHAVTTLFSLYACTAPTFGFLGRTLAWFGMWSTLAWPVNLYLALRKLTLSPKVQAKLCLAALISYVTELCINWPVFVYFIGSYMWHVSWVWGAIFACVALGLMVPEMVLILALVAQHKTITETTEVCTSEACMKQTSPQPCTQNPAPV